MLTAGRVHRLGARGAPAVVPSTAATAGRPIMMNAICGRLNCTVKTAQGKIDPANHHWPRPSRLDSVPPTRVAAARAGSGEGPGPYSPYERQVGFMNDTAADPYAPENFKAFKEEASNVTSLEFMSGSDVVEQVRQHSLHALVTSHSAVCMHALCILLLTNTRRAEAA